MQAAKVVQVVEEQEDTELEGNTEAYCSYNHAKVSGKLCGRKLREKRAEAYCNFNGVGLNGEPCGPKVPEKRT
jgi:hypothetical protein